MTKYADIIERLKKATGPDRWLDAKIEAVRGALPDLFQEVKP